MAVELNTPLDIDEAMQWLRSADTPLLRKISAAAWLIDEGLDSVEIARQLHLAPSTIRHWSRLPHKLAPAVLERLTRPLRGMSLGHLKALATLPAPAQLPLLERCIAHHYSVRKLEALVQAAPGADRDESLYYRQLSDELSSQLGFVAEIRPTRHRRGAGKVTLTFQSLDEFDALCARLKVDLSDL